MDPRRIGNDAVLNSVVRSCNHTNLQLASRYDQTAGCVYSHHDEGSNIEPNRQVGQPANALQGSNASKNGTNDGEDQQRDNKANLFICQLGNRGTTSQDQHGNGHELLKSLSNVDEVT